VSVGKQAVHGPVGVWDWWVAGCILLLAGLVLGYDIFTLPLWSDEAYTLLEVTGNLPLDGVLDWPRGVVGVEEMMRIFSGVSGADQLAEVLRRMDVHPPLYYHVARFWVQAFGSSLEALRLLSLLCALGAAALWYGTMRRVMGIYALPGLMVVVCAPPFAYAAVNARNYGWVLLLVVIVLVCIHKAWERVRAGDHAHVWLALAGIVAALALCSHYFTALLMGPLLLTVALWAGRRGWKGVCVGGAAMAGAVWVVAPFITVQFGARPAQYNGFTEVLPEVLSLLRAASNQFSVLPSPLGTLWVFCATLVLLAALAWAALRSPWPVSRVYGLGALGFFMAFFALFWYTDKTLRIFDAPRYAMFVLPIFAWLLAHALWLIGQHLSHRGVCILVGASAVGLAGMGLSARLDPPSLSQPWSWVQMVEGRTAIFAQMTQPGDLVVFTNGDYAMMPPLVVPLPSGVAAIMADRADDMALLERALADATRVALIKTLSTAPVGYDASHKRVVAVMKAAGFVERGDVWIRP